MTAQVFMKALTGFLLARAEEAEDAPGDRWSRQVLSDAEAIRQLIGRYEYCKEFGGVEGNENLDSAAEEYEGTVLPMLAARYSGHPDFRDEWMTGTRNRIWPTDTGAIAAAGDPDSWRPAPPSLSDLLVRPSPAHESGSKATAAANYGLLRPASSSQEHIGVRPAFSAQAVRQTLLAAGFQEHGPADTGFWVVEPADGSQLVVYVLRPGTFQPEEPGQAENYGRVLCAAGYLAETINPQTIVLTEGA